MREAMAVTGYLDEVLAKHLVAGEAIPYVEVRPEAHIVDVVVRVRTGDIAETRVASSKDGLTLVQLILKDAASVETIVRTSADEKGLRAFHDPVLNRVRQEATAKKIAI